MARTRARRAGQSEPEGASVGQGLALRDKRADQNAMATDGPGQASDQSGSGLRRPGPRESVRVSLPVRGATNDQGQASLSE